jgi:hypothetical protein
VAWPEDEVGQWTGARIAERDNATSPRLQ